MKTKTEEI